MQAHKPGYAAIVLGICIALIQLIDIAIHVATDQAEAIRIVSNGLILSGLVLVALLKAPRYSSFILAGASAVYLALNIIFVIQHGLTNLEQGGQPRAALILLVVLTLILSTVLAMLARRRETSI